MRRYSIAFWTVSVLFALGQFPVQAQPNSLGVATPNTQISSSTDVYFINRAKNLARQAAIKANGGLERYRPNPVMYGPAVQTSYVNNNDGSITFTFTGGVPGAATPTLETVATVRSDGSVNLDYNGALRGSAESFVPPTQAALAQPGGISPNAEVSSPMVPVNSSGPSKKGLPKLSTPALGAGISPSNPATPPPPSIPLTGNNSSFASSVADQDAFLSKARNIARQTAIKENGGLDRYRPEPSMFGPSSKSPFTKNADGSVTFKFKGGAPGSTVMMIESVVMVSATGNASIQYNGPAR